MGGTTRAGRVKLEGMNALDDQAPISPEEYREREELSTRKHEYWNGTVVAMAGGTGNHTVICSNIAGAIRQLLKGKPCRARNSEQLVRIESTNDEFYPDALIFCPPGRFVGKGDRVLLNPKVIFEVLSDSTEKKDRGSKFHAYQRCESITDYVLVSQDHILVEHFRRAEDGWSLRSYNSLDDALPFPDVDITLPLREIYEELELPSALVLLGGAPTPDDEA